MIYCSIHHLKGTIFIQAMAHTAEKGLNQGHEPRFSTNRWSFVGTQVTLELLVAQAAWVFKSNFQSLCLGT